MQQPQLKNPVIDRDSTQPEIEPESEILGDLLDKLLEANSLEQAGELSKARSLYEEIIALDKEGAYGLSAQRALEFLPANTSLIEKISEVPEQVTRDTKSTIQLHFLRKSPLPNRWRDRWRNLSFSNKLIVVLVSAAVIPVVVATQILVLLTQNSFQEDFKEKLHSNVAAWESDYILQARDDSRAEAENLGHLVENQANTLNPEDQKAAFAQKYYQLTLVRDATAASDTTRPQLTKSFRILTNLTGTTVAQSAKLHTEGATDKDGYSMLPDTKRQVDNTEFRAFETTPGINLGDLDIVKAALQTGQPQTGVEVIPWTILDGLGLGEQAAIGLRGVAKGAKEGKYLSQLDNYQAGLVAMAVYPVQVNNRIVGTTIVGVLLNRNYALTDYFRKLYNVPIVSIYAYNWEVNTTAPYTDNHTRAIGTLASKEVTDVVLNQGKELLLKENIQGVNYLTLYKPLYNYQQQVNGSVAKPIGMIAVGRAETELENLLVKQQFLGLTIASAMLLLVVIFAIPVANAFSFSLRQLARFAQQLGSGEMGTRLEATEQADEVGILARQLNDMATSVEENMQQVRFSEQQRRQEAEQQRHEKEELQRGVIDLLLQIEGAQQGDLTVHAPVTQGEVGSIADAFNTTIDSLKRLVIQVKNVTTQISQVAQTSETSVSELSTAALTQSSELTHALASVVDIANSIQRVMQLTKEAATISRRAAQAAQVGDMAMDQTVASMDKIRTSVSNTAKQAKRLAESSQEISQILTIFSKISEKADILAFNASIEAARAGEQGQGFLQVASEVRGLAQQVSESAEDIEELINSIQQDTAAVIKGMEVGTAEVVT